MEEKMLKNSEEIDIDVQRLLNALMNKTWMIAIVAVICAVISLAGTFFLITPKYKAATMFYVNNNSMSLGDAALSISSIPIPYL